MPRPDPVTMTTRPSQMPMRRSLTALPELLAQLVLVELAVVVPGQRLDELDAARTLVVRDAVAAPLDELGRRARRDGSTPGCGSTTATTISPHSSSGTPTTPTSPTAGMADQHRLDLGRIDVHAAADDEVRAAVGEEEVAVGVDVADVAEREVVARGTRPSVFSGAL